MGEGGDCLADETAGDEGPAPQLTLMHPGSALQARLTEFHTVRAHLQGEATYHLLPPHASVQPLHIYPSIHRCANQAQVLFAFVHRGRIVILIVFDAFIVNRFFCRLMFMKKAAQAVKIAAAPSLLVLPNSLPLPCLPSRCGHPEVRIPLRCRLCV